MILMQCFVAISRKVPDVEMKVMMNSCCQFNGGFFLYCFVLVCGMRQDRKNIMKVTHINVG